MDTILERIARRGRSFEKDIDPGYLRDLVDAYGRFFSSYEDAPVLMIDTSDLNFPANESDLAVVLKAVHEFPRGAKRHVISGSRDDRQQQLV